MVFVVEVPRTHGDTQNDLIVGNATPHVEVLRREIDREVVGYLILHAFEHGDLTAESR